MNETTLFTTEERNVIQDTHFFETKVCVNLKVKALLQTLHIELKKSISLRGLLAPEGFQLENHQFVKGEHLLDFPYLYLDFPKHFKNKEMLTFRTLFWWGHYFVFSLLLEGQYLDRYKQNLLSDYDSFSDRGCFILLTENPWEWQLKSAFLLEIQTDNQAEVERILESRTFLKVHQYLKFDDKAVKEGKVIEEALASFHLMWTLVMDEGAVSSESGQT